MVKECFLFMRSFQFQFIYFYFYFFSGVFRPPPPLLLLDRKHEGVDMEAKAQTEDLPFISCPQLQRIASPMSRHVE